MQKKNWNFPVQLFHKNGVKRWKENTVEVFYVVNDVKKERLNGKKPTIFHVKQHHFNDDIMTSVWLVHGNNLWFKV